MPQGKKKAYSLGGKDTDQPPWLMDYMYDNYMFMFM